IVHAAIVTVTAAAAVRAAMEARSASAGYRNRDANFCVFERRQRHGLACSNTEAADADHHRGRKKFIHSFLLLVVSTTCAPDLFECTVHSLTERLVARAEKSFHIFGGQSKTGEDIAIPFLNGCTDSISSG